MSHLFPGTFAPLPCLPLYIKDSLRRTWLLSACEGWLLWAASEGDADDAVPAAAAAVCLQV
jgi:hypothetical protein